MYSWAYSRTTVLWEWKHTYRCHVIGMIELCVQRTPSNCITAVSRNVARSQHCQSCVLHCYRYCVIATYQSLQLLALLQLQAGTADSASCYGREHGWQAAWQLCLWQLCLWGILLLKDKRTKKYVKRNVQQLTRINEDLMRSMIERKMRCLRSNDILKCMLWNWRTYRTSSAPRIPANWIWTGARGWLKFTYHIICIITWPTCPDRDNWGKGGHVTIFLVSKAL